MQLRGKKARKILYIMLTVALFLSGFLYIPFTDKYVINIDQIIIAIIICVPQRKLWDFVADMNDDKIVIRDRISALLHSASSRECEIDDKHLQLKIGEIVSSEVRKLTRLEKINSPKSIYNKYWVVETKSGVTKCLPVGGFSKEQLQVIFNYVNKYEAS